MAFKGIATFGSLNKKRRLMRRFLWLRFISAAISTWPDNADLPWQCCSAFVLVFI